MLMAGLCALWPSSPSPCAGASGGSGGGGGSVVVIDGAGSCWCACCCCAMNCSSGGVVLGHMACSVFQALNKAMASSAGAAGLRGWWGVAEELGIDHAAGAAGGVGVGGI